MASTNRLGESSHEAERSPDEHASQLQGTIRDLQARARAGCCLATHNDAAAEDLRGAQCAVFADADQHDDVHAKPRVEVDDSPWRRLWLRKPDPAFHRGLKGRPELQRELEDQRLVGLRVELNFGVAQSRRVNGNST